MTLGDRPAIWGLERANAGGRHEIPPSDSWLQEGWPGGTTGRAAARVPRQETSISNNGQGPYQLSGNRPRECRWRTASVPLCCRSDGGRRRAGRDRGGMKVLKPERSAARPSHGSRGTSQARLPFGRCKSNCFKSLHGLAWDSSTSDTSTSDQVRRRHRATAVFGLTHDSFGRNQNANANAQWTGPLRWLAF